VIEIDKQSTGNSIKQIYQEDTV
jgi:hypothetical protein